LTALHLAGQSIRNGESDSVSLPLPIISINTYPCRLSSEV
jgi:hypothetical protein